MRASCDNQPMMRGQVAEWTRQILGKTWQCSQVIDTTPAARLTTILQSVLLDVTPKGDMLASGYHWVYHNPSLNHLGKDGYDNYQAPVDAKGNSLFERRMWVSGRVDFCGDIKYNTSVNCVERIKSVRYLGQRCFVEIERSFGVGRRPALLELRTLAYTNERYRENLPRQSPPISNCVVQVPQVANFRYSALTFNAHKIHYDAEYCRQVEGIPGVIVSGPFLITILLQWFRSHNPHLTIQSITYKNRAPVFAAEPVSLHANKVTDTQYSATMVSNVIVVQATINTTLAS